MSNNDFDWGIVDSSAQDAQSLQFPVIMWRNGQSDMEDLGENNVNFTGGFFFSYDHAGEGTTINGWNDASFKGDKEKIHGLAAKAAHIVIVRGRKRWFKEDEDRTYYFPWNEYQKGCRAQYQGIGFVRGFSEPVCFTFKGRNVDFLKSVLKEHYSKLVALANRESPDKSIKLPNYAIWMPVKAGKHVEVGQAKKSEITPPEISLPKSVDINFVRERYIGKEMLIRCQDLYRELDQWATEWEQGGAKQPNGHKDEEPALDAGARSAKAVAYDMQKPADMRASSAPDDPFGERLDHDDIPF